MNLAADTRGGTGGAEGGGTCSVAFLRAGCKVPRVQSGRGRKETQGVDGGGLKWSRKLWGIPISPTRGFLKLVKGGRRAGRGEVSSEAGALAVYRQQREGGALLRGWGGFET